MAVTAGIGSDHVDLQAAIANKIDVVEVTYCNSEYVVRGRTQPTTPPRDPLQHGHAIVQLRRRCPWTLARSRGRVLGVCFHMADMAAGPWRSTWS